MIDQENIEKAINIAESIKRQFNNPVEISRRRDDWKIDMMKDQLNRIINILKGGEDYGDNAESEGTTPLDSTDGKLDQKKR